MLSYLSKDRDIVILNACPPKPFQGGRRGAKRSKGSEHCDQILHFVLRFAQDFVQNDVPFLDSTSEQHQRPSLQGRFANSTGIPYFAEDHSQVTMGSLLLLLPLMMTPSDTLSRAALQNLLPTSLYQWSFAELSKIYTGREIFQYMDGAGEVYLAYGFQRLLVQRYARSNQEEILVEIFDMGVPRNAYGAFTNMQGRSPAVEIGQGGEYKSGLLNFWKGRFFVCVMIDRENEEAKKAVFGIAAMISEYIREVGLVPEIISMLPDGLYSQETVRYFYRNEILNIHYYVADKNIFHLNESTEAVLARNKNDKSYLLLIHYPSGASADSGYAEFMAQYMPESHGSGIVQTENKKWTVCRRRGRGIMAVFDVPTRDEAQKLLDIAQRRFQ